MHRVLTTARVAVAPTHEAEWLATVQALATRLAQRGLHLWVFRSREEPGLFLEFTEGKDDASHRRHGPHGAAEAALEARLREVAHYSDDCNAPWDEIPASLGEGRS